ncbi:MAG: ABC transporter permease [Blautia sp.]|nr:ABC transporter permease [Blautia sp.]
MIFQSLKMAWHAISSNKFQTFLTMLGVIIGVAVLIVLVSIVNGATASVTDTIDQMGNSYLTVTITDDKENPLRLKELSEFTVSDEIDAAAPFANTSVTAKSGYTSGSMSLTGTTGSYAEIEDMELISGRFIKNADVENSSYVVVLTRDTAVELLGRADVAGETVSLDGRSFLVIGVLADNDTMTVAASKSTSDSGESSVNLEGYIPFSTMTRITDNVLDVTRFYVKASREDTLDYAKAEITSQLMDRFGQDEEAFSVNDMSQVMEAMASITSTLSLMLGGIAAISLLVGGIGIMNIMMVSVTERTREIGIRKAIGAGRGSIMLQFMLEALMISLMGCVFGIGVSVAILKAVSFIMQNSMNFSVNQKAALLSVAFSCAIGVIFGIYPANKAARKKPIDALRF